jgi:hypothetical protein
MTSLQDGELSAPGLVEAERPSDQFAHPVAGVTAPMTPDLLRPAAVEDIADGGGGGGGGAGAAARPWGGAA